MAGTCFLADQILMSVDHVFSISVALGGGVLWFAFGFWTVFLFGACIAAVNLATALGMKGPRVGTPSSSTPSP